MTWDALDARAQSTPPAVTQPSSSQPEQSSSSQASGPRVGWDLTLYPKQLNVAFWREQAGKYEKWDAQVRMVASPAAVAQLTWQLQQQAAATPAPRTLSTHCICRTAACSALCDTPQAPPVGVQIPPVLGHVSVCAGAAATALLWVWVCAEPCTVLCCAVLHAIISCRWRGCC